MAIVVFVLVLLALVAFLVGAVLAHRTRDTPTMAMCLGLALWVASVLIQAFPVG